MYETSGLAGMLQLKKAKGAVPKMTAEAKKDLLENLANEKGFASYGEIQAFLWDAPSNSIELFESPYDGAL